MVPAESAYMKSRLLRLNLVSEVNSVFRVDVIAVGAVTFHQVIELVFRVYA
jgi:hypothetical protein